MPSFLKIVRVPRPTEAELRHIRKCEKHASRIHRVLTFARLLQDPVDVAYAGGSRGYAWRKICLPRTKGGDDATFSVREMDDSGHKQTKTFKMANVRSVRVEVCTPETIERLLRFAADEQHNEEVEIDCTDVDDIQATRTILPKLIMDDGTLISEDKTNNLPEYQTQLTRISAVRLLIDPPVVEKDD